MKRKLRDKQYSCREFQVILKQRPIIQYVSHCRSHFRSDCECLSSKNFWSLKKCGEIYSKWNIHYNVRQVKRIFIKWMKMRVISYCNDKSVKMACLIFLFFFFFFYRILQIRNSVRLKFKIIKRCIPIHVHTAIIPFFSFFFFFLLLLLLTMQKRSKWIFTIGFSPRNYTRVMRAGWSMLLFVDYI